MLDIVEGTDVTGGGRFHLQHVDHTIITFHCIVDFSIAFESLILLALTRPGFPRSSSSRVCRGLDSLGLRLVEQVLFAFIDFGDSITTISVDLNVSLA